MAMDASTGSGPSPVAGHPVPDGGATSASNAAGQSPPGPDQLEGSIAARAEFAGFLEAYVRHYISQADAKAGILFGVLASSIGYLFARPGFHNLIFRPRWEWPGALALPCAALFLSAAVAALLVVAPRMGRPGTGIVFFGSVTRFADADAYVAAVRELDRNGLVAARLRHGYDVSGVCWRKYRMLGTAAWIAGAAFVLALPLLAAAFRT